MLNAIGGTISRVRSLYFIVRKILRIDATRWTPVRPRTDLRKIGSKYGGWTVPTDVFHEGSVCYCVGCGEDISFDLSLIELFGCEVFGFDPTPRAIEYVKQVTVGVDRYHFFEVGIWDKDDTIRFYGPRNMNHVSHSAVNMQRTDYYFEAKVKRLSKLMHSLGHSCLDLLKLDVEGAEYRVLNSLIDDKVSVRVLCVEFDELHTPLDNHYRRRIRDIVKRLRRYGFSIVASEPNGNVTFVHNATSAAD